jgi:hypothetical protein
MGLKLRQGGAWRDITGLRIFASGAWRQIRNVKIYAGGAWRDGANLTTGGGSIAVTLSASSISRNARLSTINSPAVTATPTGGQVPYSYAWVKQSGGAIVATAPSSSSSQFQGANMEIDETRTAVFRCTATDAFGSTASADVSVSLTRLEPIDIGGTQ